MKKILALCALVALSSYAAEIKIASIPVGQYDVVTPRFNINADLGRAWVEVEVINEAYYLSEDSAFYGESQLTRYRLPGRLSPFDWTFAS